MTTSEMATAPPPNFWHAVLSFSAGMLLLLAPASARSDGRGLLGININPADGSFNVTMGGAIWLASGEVRAFADGLWHSQANGSLALMGHTQYNASDELGPYTALSFSWLLKHAGIILRTAVHSYTNHDKLMYSPPDPTQARLFHVPSPPLAHTCVRKPTVLHPHGLSGHPR